MADVAAGFVGEENVDRNYPRMAGGEDFAFMLEKSLAPIFASVRAARRHTIRTLISMMRSCRWLQACWRQRPKTTSKLNGGGNSAE